ncbi:putative histone-arginine methyltransferase 1.4, partial [Coemansia sp. S100]
MSKESSREAEANPREDDEVLHRDPSYFQYYSQLQHQQNMLQDYVRTSSYHSAITLNGAALFRDRIVMDVGAGSGILSFFAAQAGAKHVHAVEASGMANKMKVILEAAKRKNAARNAYLADRITVVGSKIEDPRLLESTPKVDVIISEPIGVLLVHERMLESFVYARDKFL